VRKVIAVLGLAGLLVPALAGAAEIFEKVGTFDGQFLKIGVGARAAGMGGAFVGVADDATSLFWNAAGIARIDPDKSEFSFNHAFWPADMSHTQAGYVFHLKRFPGAFGLQFSAGGTVNFIHEGLAEFSQQTTAFDVGTLYDVGAFGMRIGMAIANIGSQVTFIDREGRIPGIFRVGTSFNLMQSADQKLIGSFEFSHPPDNSERMNVGAEYSFQKYLFLRGGYNINYDAEGLAGGVGMHIPVSVVGQADLDYAYTDMKDLGSVHRLSLKFLF
jgi:hypothetical protein